jgi:predicted DNA binding protein
VRDNRIKATFLGNSRDIKRLLGKLDRAELGFRVISLSDAKFSPSSPLRGLTDKQRKVLLTAFKLGYYDPPRRISSRELGKKLNIRSSTLTIHLIKAERRVLTDILSGSSE